MREGVDSPIEGEAKGVSEYFHSPKHAHNREDEQARMQGKKK